MFRNNFRVAFRSLLKNKVYSLINIAGLSIGMAVFVLILLYIQHERTFDQFHTHKDRIYRIQQDRFNRGERTLHSVTGCYAAGPAIKASFPEVVDYVALHKVEPIIAYKGEGFKEENTCFATDKFFKYFSFRLLKGVDTLVLKEPHTAVVSRSFANRVFKNEDPIGKTLSFRGTYDFDVTGVFEDMPENSHMKFDLMISYPTLEKHPYKGVLDLPWQYDGIMTYLVLRDDANAAELEAKFPDFIMANTGTWLEETDQKMTWQLQPLTSIHLYSDFDHELGQNGDYHNIEYLTVVAIFILVIAWFNYISLATAKSLERAKEVGIRKVLGSYRIQLVGQFLLESIFLNLAAGVLACFIVYAMLPTFNNLMSTHVTLSLLRPEFWWIMAGILFGGSLASGMYPAFFLSTFKPSLILNGNFTTSSTGRWVRRGMVMIPFITAIILVSCLYIIFSQISFLRKQRLGFDVTQRLVIRDSEIYDSLADQRIATYKNEMMRIPGVKANTFLNVVPGDHILYSANGVRRIKDDDTKSYQYQRLWVDENFVDVLDLRLLAGRNFTQKSIPRKTLFVNEKALSTLGFEKPEDAIDEKILFMDDTATIIGVVNDFHHESPRDPILPVIYAYRPEGGLFYLIKIETAQAQPVVQKLEALFKQVFPGQPFSYYFLDEKYNRQYKRDIQFGELIGFFSTLLVLVTALGLFGLSAYMASVRTREIGIRKVLGATEKGIVLLLCREYLILIFLATCIAVPTAWYAMDNWLNNFAVKVEINIWMFALPTLLLLLITLLTISFQTLRAALSNPVDALRHE
ncbi:putative ABC transport system permease protein [Chryseolinea serpens]|uniref:Putative ABC transport system permease protein n=1 Tax=Chryseolinea serpens TaxID=947013 RepID=A0A1M5XM52_9BACT|nr:ABC transporter permease [Chryseolinea serpens]SHI00618.1 putative ABC transport system permease protein [Chryseolinea serpens]